MPLTFLFNFLEDKNGRERVQIGHCCTKRVVVNILLTFPFKTFTSTVIVVFWECTDMWNMSCRIACVCFPLEGKGTLKLLTITCITEGPLCCFWSVPLRFFSLPLSVCLPLRMKMRHSHTEARPSLRVHLVDMLISIGILAYGSAIFKIRKSTIVLFVWTLWW